MTPPSHRLVTVRLVGEDGNTVLVVGRARRSLRGGTCEDGMFRFEEEVRLDDYRDLLATVARWIEVSG